MTRDAPEEDPLPELLDSLETTLSALREELDPGATRNEWERSTRDRRRRQPRPPRMREVLRFTDEYTIPALVAVLEANVRLLKLAQAGIRALDPARAAGDDGVGPLTLGNELRRVAGDAGRTSADRLASSLSDLQRALEEADTPESPEARNLLADARDLSAEIERRVRESREQSDLSRFGGGDGGRWSQGGAARGGADDAPVRIEVQDESEREESDENDDTDDADPGVDVDAELDSIKREMSGPEDDEGGAGGDESEDRQ